MKFSYLMPIYNCLFLNRSSLVLALVKALKKLYHCFKYIKLSVIIFFNDFLLPN